MSLLPLWACAVVFAAGPSEMPKIPTVAIPVPLQGAIMPVAVQPGPLSDEGLSAFLAKRNADVQASRPDLYRLKLEKSFESDFAFFRGMPDLFYDLLARSSEAEALRASPHVILDGDPHAENVEIVAYKGRLTPQFNDFDDSTRGPAALDMARMLAGAAALGRTNAQRRQLAAEARQAYLDGLDLKFSDWNRGVSQEPAVARGELEHRRWLEKGGVPVTNGALIKALFKLTGLDADKWSLLDRAGAGLSSIGVRRFLFARKDGEYARELKQLREEAVSAFTGRPEPSEAPRVARAYEELRKSPVDVSTLSGLGVEWMLRRREGAQRTLNLAHAKSAARVLGGLLAQAHRKQAAPEALAAAMQPLTPTRVVVWLTDMGRMRASLGRLLKK